ncbi:MAG: hypothetical protein WCI97_02515 [Bacteroidota bacterium]
MKKNYSILFFFFAFVTNGQAENQLFQYNKPKVEAAFQKINEVEEMIEQKNLSYSQMMKLNPCLMEDANLNLEDNQISKSANLPLGIPSFVWGLCVGIIGIVIVAVSKNNTEEQVGGAIAGCLVNAFLVSMVYFAVTGALNFSGL